MKISKNYLKKLIKEELSKVLNENEAMQQGEGRLQRALQNLGRINLARGTGGYATREPEDPRDKSIEVLVDGKLVAHIFSNGSVVFQSDEPELEAEFRGNKL